MFHQKDAMAFYNQSSLGNPLQILRIIGYIKFPKFYLLFKKNIGGHCNGKNN